jgi:hypothetical protein
VKNDYHAGERERLNNFKQESEVVVFEEIKEEELGEHKSHQLEDSNHGTARQPEIEFIFAFNPSSFSGPETLKPYCILQKYDFDVKYILTQESDGGKFVGSLVWSDRLGEGEEEE